MANRKRLDEELFAGNGVLCPGEEETIGLGARLAPAFAAGDVISLEGPLGAGKTRLVKGLARGLGLKDEPTSPTFTILHEYREGADFPLFHFDFYRLKSRDELDLAGFEDCLGAGLVVAEWGEKFLECLPSGTLRLRLEPGEGGARRIRAEWMP